MNGYFQGVIKDRIMISQFDVNIENIEEEEVARGEEKVTSSILINLIMKQT
jgi:hypothetical protein